MLPALVSTFTYGPMSIQHEAVTLKGISEPKVKGLGARCIAQQEHTGVPRLQEHPCSKVGRFVFSENKKNEAKFGRSDFLMPE